MTEGESLSVHEAQTQSIALNEGQSLVGLWMSCAIGWEWGKPTCQSRGFNLIRWN